MASPINWEPRARPERRANGTVPSNRQEPPGSIPSPAGRINASNSWPAAGRQPEPRRSSPPFSPLDFGPLSPPPTASESPYRKKKLWPPAPRCEDEKVSLAREAGHEYYTVPDDEVPFRGTIDQEPIIQYAPGQEPVGTGASSGVITPHEPVTNDEHLHDLPRQHSSCSNVQDEIIPELAKRASTPYAYTRPSKPKNNGPVNEKLLPDPISLSQVKRSALKQPSRSNPSSPRRDSHRLSPANKYGPDYFTLNIDETESAIDDPDSDAQAATSSLRNPSNAPYKSSRQNSTAGRRPALDARRNTDSFNTFPTGHKLKIDKTRRPTPLMVSSALSELNDAPTLMASPDGLRLGEAFSPRSAGLREPLSRGPSPSTIPLYTERSPHPSPRASLDVQQDVRTSSATNSRASSLAGSRPVSPSPRTSSDASRPRQADLDWNALLATQDRPSTTQHASRDVPAAFVHSHSIVSPVSPVSVNARPSTSHSLPYPEDDVITIPMPLESDHQYLWDRPSTSIPPARDRAEIRQNSSGGSSNLQPFGQSGHSLASRRSVANIVTTEARSANAATRPSPAISADTRKELSALLKRGLPECPRPHPVAGYDDWYVVVGAPSLELCPDCVDAVFERTLFRPMIRRAPPKNLKLRTQCAFGGSAWTRLAWLLTLQHQRTDLSLMKDIAEIEATSEPCPAGREAVRTWYGLRDVDGLYVQDFHVCFHDVRKIERLLPSLSGMFVRLPNRASYESHVCAMRIEGNRFSMYLDALISTHEQATKTRKPADPMPLISLVEKKLQLRECTRDNMLIGGLWHFIPNIPQFTVCEDCFETVVEPEIRKRSDIAGRFNRTVQPVYGEGMGTSCQLYSRRMRRIFQRAVEDKDWRYLARKAAERRDAEVRLQERYKEVMRRARRISREGYSDEHDERRLQHELEKIKHEWQSKWE